MGQGFPDGRKTPPFVTPTIDTLAVPGASIYYEVRGTGPVLLMICGGPTDAGVFAGVANALADRFRVVTYDPRGNSRSVVNGPPEDQRLDVHGDDAAALLAKFGDEPAYVFGNSGGAQIGLNLTARYPHRVRVLIAHEPPCMQLLPDAGQQKALLDAVLETFRTSGARAAFAEFQDMAGMNPPAVQDGPPKESPSPEMLQTFGRIQRNLDFFFAHGMVPLGSYVPDVAALRAGPPVVAGVGELTEGQSPHRAAVALADKLGIAPVAFPGDHGGFARFPQAFAERMNELFVDGHPV
jgi:pimeloyl-ACP methyl ester carboxylesterase